jgi:ABC-type oligopeptide transport system substrate-binding subunit
VVDADNISAASDRWALHPNASGPYTLQALHENEVVIFERNPAYHAPPAIAHVVFLLQAGGTALSLYEAGDIDVAGLAPADRDRISQPDDALHADWQSATSLCTSLLVLDTAAPPLDDPHFRQALAWALDREALNDRFNEGGALLAHSVLPPAMPGYSADLPRFGHDPAAAQAALAASAYAGSDIPTLVINEGGMGEAPSDFVTAVADMWREALGVEVEIRQLDPSDYSRAAREQHGHVVSYGWCADYPDPENFLDVLFHSESEFNVAGYADPQVDAWLEAARSEPDPAERLALYHQVETALLEDAAAIPLVHNVFDIVVKPYVQGYVLAPLGAPIIPLLSLDR